MIIKKNINKLIIFILVCIILIAYNNNKSIYVLEKEFYLNYEYAAIPKYIEYIDNYFFSVGSRGFIIKKNNFNNLKINEDLESLKFNIIINYFGKKVEYNNENYEQMENHIKYLPINKCIDLVMTKIDIVHEFYLIENTWKGQWKTKKTIGNLIGQNKIILKNNNKKNFTKYIFFFLYIIILIYFINKIEKLNSKELFHLK